MEIQQQMELESIVGDVLENYDECFVNNNKEGENLDNNNREINQSDDNSSRRSSKRSSFAHKNSRKNTDMYAQLIDQNQLLKQKTTELLSQIQHIKTSHDQLKKSYEQQISQFKSQRYEFLDVLAQNLTQLPSTIRSRKQSSYGFRDSINNNNKNQNSQNGSSIISPHKDLLFGLNINLTGSLPSICHDLLSCIKKQRKQHSTLQSQLYSYQDHCKDLKLSYQKLLDQQKSLKNQLKLMQILEGKLQKLQKQNQEYKQSEYELLKTIGEIEQQKGFLRNMVDKLKQQKDEIIKKYSQRNQMTKGVKIKGSYVQNYKYNMRQSGQNNQGSGFQINIHPDRTSKINIMHAPSYILRQMGSQIIPSSQIQPLNSHNLNTQINKSKQPEIIKKYQQKIQKLQGIIQNKHIKIRQLERNVRDYEKVMKQSVEKSQQIENEIKRRYEKLFEQLQGKENEKNEKKNNYEEQKQKDEENKNKDEQFIDQRQNKNETIEVQQKNQRPYNPSQIFSLLVPPTQPQQLSSISQQKQQSHPLSTLCSSSSVSKLQQFSTYIKTLLSSYKQKQYFMAIQIQSLRNQVKMLGNIIKEKEEKEEQQNKQKKQQCNQENYNNENKQSQYVEIQQGQQINQYQLEIVKNITKMQQISQQLQQQHQQQHQLQNKQNQQDQSIQYIQNNNIEYLKSQQYNHYQNNNKSTIKYKSEFYNESFIQIGNNLSKNILNKLNKIQQQIKQKQKQKQRQRQQITYKQRQTQEQIDIIHKYQQSNDILHNKPQTQNQKPSHTYHNYPQPQILPPSIPSAQLLQKLHSLSVSFNKISSYHHITQQQIQSQLNKQFLLIQNKNNQLMNEKNSLIVIKLKEQNEKLKQELVKNVVFKYHVKENVDKIRIEIDKFNHKIIENMANLQQKQQNKQQKQQQSQQQATQSLPHLQFHYQTLSSHYQSLQQSIHTTLSHLQPLLTFLPQIESLTSPTPPHIQLLYQTQKHKNTQLNEQINILMETLTEMRNIAINDDYDD